MATSFNYKLISNLSKKRKEGGFTLIELLVVVIIIGVLAAVALPNLLGQVGKARETEGKNGVGSINRAQQSYHFERQTFADGTNVEDAQNELGVVIDPDYYAFTVTGAADASDVTAIDAAAKDNGTRNFAGAVDFADGAYTSVVCISETVDGTVSAAAGACTGGPELK